MALMDVFTHFSIIRRERRGIRPEEIKDQLFGEMTATDIYAQSKGGYH
jgi:hypothetical protein